MIFILLGSFIIGMFLLINIKKNINILDILLLPIPLGIAINSILFTILGFFQIIYSKYLFLLIIVICLISFIYSFKKKKIKIQKLNIKIPIYYILFLLFIIIRLLILSGTSLFDSCNIDEFNAYHVYSKDVYDSLDFSGTYRIYSPISYFIGTMSYQIDGSNLNSARMFSPIFFGMISLFIFYTLSKNKINRHVASLISILYIVSSCENLYMAMIFYNSMYFSLFITYAFYYIINGSFINNDIESKKIGYAFLLFTMLTRRECIFYIPFIISIFMFIKYARKNINIKQLILYVGIPLIISAVLIVSKNLLYNPDLSSVSNNLTIIDTIKTRMNYNSVIFISRIADLTLLNNDYYFNRCSFLVFIYFIFITIFMILEKMNGVKISNEKILRGMNIILIFQIIYMGIIIFSEYALFAFNEFLIAAYFSKYILAILPINFILLGLYIFIPNSKKNQ